MRKRLQKISIFLGIFLIIGLCGTFFFIRSETFLNWVEKRLKTELENRIAKHYTANIGDIKGNILGSVTVENIAISKKDAPDPPVISTQKVVLRYNLLGLLTRKFEVKELTVHNPQIHAEHNPDGNLNLSRIFQESQSNEGTPQFGFAIELLHFNEGTIDYTDIQRNLNIKINGISVKLQGPLDTWKHDGTLEIDAGSFTFNGSETAIDNFDAQFSLLANRNELRNLHIKFGNSNLRAKGGFTHGEIPVSWDGSIDLELDVADVQQFLSEDITLEGMVKSQLTMSGTDSTLDGTLIAEMPTFFITQTDNSRRVALADLNIDADFNFDPTPTVNFNTFSAQIADGAVVGDGSITLENTLTGDLLTQLQQLPSHPFSYKGKWSATEVRLIPLLSMFVQLPENLANSIGRLAGTAEFNGNSRDIATLQLNSKIALTETTLDEVELEDSTLNCTVTAGELKANGNLDETEISITGPFPVAQQDVLDIRVSGINFDDLMKLANSTDLGGTAAVSAKLSGGILKGFIEVPNATFNDIPIGVLAGDFRYQDGRVFIENGLMTKNTKNDLVTEYTSRTTINGVVDIKGEFPADFSVVADPVYVQHYPKVLLGAEYPVDGEIRGELKLDGTLIDLDGSANFSVTKGVAWGIHLDPLMLPLEIEDYNFTLPDFKITTRGQQVTFNVSVASNGDYDLLLESDAPVRLEEIAKAANISDFPFEGAFDVRVVGVLKKPADADFRVELDFSDVTFLHNGRGTKHLLGDVYLLGRLVERRKTTGEPDIFDFQGHGFEGTSQIQGYVSMATGNPYHFTAENKAFEVTPVLSILHPLLESVTGVADGSASISGTIADLAPPVENEASESDEQQIYPYDVDILVTTTQLRYEHSAKREMSFTNAEPIRLNLKDDKWTIDALSLRTSEDKSPFIQLAGTFDAKSEAINLDVISSEFALPPFGDVLGLPHNMLQAGAARYDLKVSGTSTEPIVRLEWEIPTLTLETEIGSVGISDADGAIMYQEKTLRFEGCDFKFFDNDVNLEGYIDVKPEEINDSELHLRVDTIALDLATLPMEAIDNLGTSNGITGILEASIEIGGTLAEPLALLYAETAGQSPIRFASYIPSIALERLRIDVNFGPEFIRVQTLEANGQMGDGTYSAQGNAVFSRKDAGTMQFEINVSASKIEIGDYGFASGYVNLSGIGLDPQQITVMGEINELELDGYDFRLINSAPLQFRSNPTETIEETPPLAVHIPLQLTSPTMTAAMEVNITGTLTAPEIMAAWQGTVNEMEWTGKIQYRNERINVIGIELKNSEGMLTLAGVIPFNLTFAAMDVSERFLSEPIDVHLQGSELPLNFFPWIDTLFSEANGTVDIDLYLKGTSRSPHIVGHVSLEALQLQLENFHEPIRNMKIQIKAREDMVEVSELQFEMGSGYCTLQQSELVLDGLVPKEFVLTGLRFELFPLGSTIRHALPPELLEEVDGHLSVTLNELRVPLNRFLMSGETVPFPHVREIPSLADLVTVSSADLLIKSIRFTFKALDRFYDFQDPQSTPIALSNGTVVLAKPFTLENQDEFSVRQTFTDEDTKPDGLEEDEQTFLAKTTLSIDAGSEWSVNGEFDAALRFKNFDVSTITELLPAPYRVTGALSGSLQMSGTSENPKITLRRHESEPAELYLNDVPIDLRWRIRYQNGKWEISKRRYVEVKFGENLLTFSWTMPYQLELIPLLMELQQTPDVIWKELRNTRMDGILDIDVKDFEILPLVVPGLESATGTGEIHVELTGTVDAPQAIGSVLFNDVRLEFPDAGINIEDTGIKLQLSEKGGSITQFDGKLNDGNFSVRGSIAAPPDRRIWQTPPVLDLYASLTSTVFEQQGEYRVDIDSTELRLSGELLRPRLTGNLHIGGGYYQQSWEIVQDLLTRISVKETDVALDYPILRDLYLDVDINIPDNFRVLSSITGPTDVEISCLGKLIGPVSQPIFSGSVSVLNGRIGLITQTFEFMEGSTVSNLSTVDFNPDLNILLQTPNRIRGILPRDESTVDIQVRAALTGTLKNYNFTLSASPETTTEVLTHEDIMEFLLRNAAFSGVFGGFRFSVHRPLAEDARSISAEYPLGENVSIKIETNEKREHGIDVEFKGRF